MSVARLTQDAVLRIGQVCGVDGRRIYVLVDKNKNLSDMFLDGDILRNISVNSYIELRKGFLSLIGRVEGEEIEEEYRPANEKLEVVNRNKRILTVALSGYIDERGAFTGGTKELPLMGNEAYIVTKEKIRIVHNLVRDNSPSITIASIYGDDFDIDLPIDGLFNSHIAIFGNTGSGKSNTLAHLYQELTKTLMARNSAAFKSNTRFVLFDFNGEYKQADCISGHKKVYNLSTRSNAADRLPITTEALLEIEVLSILADATDKTQRPFLRRALRLYERVRDADNPLVYMRSIIRERVKDTLQLSDKLRAYLLLDYFKSILPEVNADGELVDLDGDIEWQNNSSEFKIKKTQAYLCQNPDRIDETFICQHVETFEFTDSLLGNLIFFLYLQLVADVIANRAQNDHIAPVINRLRNKEAEIAKVFDMTGEGDFWESNFVVVNLSDVSLDMKKTLPLLLSKRLYAEHKTAGADKTLTIIVDEAHNILSTESFREAESWKDYRLETFEEIIKEGRKFGVFVTIASQRPNDISPTITSQAHNYFIHRLINQHDLNTIANAVSYIDRVTSESIPTLPTGTCIFSGVASQMPLKINIRPLGETAKPQSDTRKFSDAVPQTVLEISVISAA